MSVLFRVAAFATLTLSVAGMIAPRSAVQAAPPAHGAPAAPTVIAMNLPTASGVPAPIDKIVVAQPAPRPVEAIADDLRDGDTVVYPTLAAAVAAQTVSSDEDEQLRCLATSIYFEAKGEPLAGQLAVAEVILNRAEAKRFGDGICGVVRQPGQFSFVRGGRIPSVDASRPAYRIALAIAKVAMADVWDSPAENALYFHARRVSTGWRRTRIASIGNHIFYR